MMLNEKAVSESYTRCSVKITTAVWIADQPEELEKV